MSTFLIHTDQLPELAKLIAQFIPGASYNDRHIISETTLDSKPKDIMSVDDLREFLPNKPTRASIYGLTHRKKIPFHKPTGRHIYFIKEEIEKWISEKRCEVSSEFTTKPKQGRTKSSAPENNSSNL